MTGKSGKCQGVTFTKDILSAGGQSQSGLGLRQSDEKGAVPEILSPDCLICPITLLNLKSGTICRVEEQDDLIISVLVQLLMLTLSLKGMVHSFGGFEPFFFIHRVRIKTGNG